MRKLPDNWTVWIALMIVLVVFSGFIPAIFSATGGTETKSVGIEEEEIITLKAPLEATLINTQNDQINVTVIDSDTGDIVSTQNLALSQTETLTIRNNNVSVTYTEDIGNTSAIVTFQYPTFYEWGEAEKAFVNIIAIILLSLFLYFLYIAIFPEGTQ